MQFFKNNLIVIIGIITGALLSYIFRDELACISGSCIITSSSIGTVLYGGFAGGLLFNLFPQKIKLKK